MSAIDTPPQGTKEESRDWSDTAGDFYDFFKEKLTEAYEKIFGESKDKREELKKKVEEDRKKYVEKDGFRFELWDGKEDPAELQKDLGTIVEKKDNAYEGKAEGVVTAAKMIEKTGYSREEKVDLKSYMHAESLVESGKYSQSYKTLSDTEVPTGHHKGTRALGRYQVMPYNWLAWSKEVFDDKVVKPTHQAQEYVAFQRFKQMYESAKTAISKSRPYAKYRRDVFYAMACTWYSGRFTKVSIPKVNWEIVLANSGEIDKYAQDVLHEMGFKKSIVKMVGSRVNKAIGKAVKH